MRNLARYFWFAATYASFWARLCYSVFKHIELLTTSFRNGWRQIWWHSFELGSTAPRRSSWIVGHNFQFLFAQNRYSSVSAHFFFCAHHPSSDFYTGAKPGQAQELVLNSFRKYEAKGKTPTRTRTATVLLTHKQLKLWRKLRKDKRKKKTAESANSKERKNREEKNKSNRRCVNAEAHERAC